MGHAKSDCFQAERPYGEGGMGHKQAARAISPGTFLVPFWGYMVLNTGYLGPNRG